MFDGLRRNSWVFGASLLDLRRPLATLASSLRAYALRSLRFASNVLGPLARASSTNSLVGSMCVVVALVLLPRSLEGLELLRGHKTTVNPFPFSPWWFRHARDSLP